MPGALTRTTCLHLGALLLTIFLAYQGLFSYRHARAGAHASALQKTRHYEACADGYDVIYLGDSRTYCGIHPSALDSLLGTHSINLSMFAHWLPTQYAQFKELVPMIPAGTTVVWSLGHTNFRPIGDSWWNADTYPLSWHHLPAFLRWGYPMRRLLASVPPLHSFAELRHWCRIGYTKLRGRLSRVVWTRMLKRAVPSAAARPAATYTAVEDHVIVDLVARCTEEPGAERVTVLYDDDLATSLEILRDDGAYRRVELVGEYFRDKQREHAEDLTRKVGEIESADVLEHPFTGPGRPEDLPHPAFWKTFLGILDLFEGRDLTLIVNEMSEAPYTYVTAARREAFRAFLGNQVRPEVERRGHIYTVADFRSLTDADFFDYNHLNSRGIAKYTPLLARELQPHVSGAR